MLKDFSMSKAYSHEYNRIYEIVVSDLLRRTFSNTPLKKSGHSQFKKILSRDFVPLANSIETMNALNKLSIWMIENRKHIVSSCFFGSTVSNCTTKTSVSIPKENGEYTLNTILVGPSDIDGLIIVDKKIGAFPSHISTFKKYDSFCLSGEDENKDILTNVMVILLNELESSIIFSQRLYPMYYRMLIKAGHWILDSAGVRDVLIAHNKKDEESLLSCSFSFYSRRINALSAFLNSLCINRVQDGYVYGAENCPNKLVHQT